MFKGCIFTNRRDNEHSANKTTGYFKKTKNKKTGNKKPPPCLLVLSAAGRHVHGQPRRDATQSITTHTHTYKRERGWKRKRDGLPGNGCCPHQSPTHLVLGLLGAAFRLQDTLLQLGKLQPEDERWEESKCVRKFLKNTWAREWYLGARKPPLRLAADRGRCNGNSPDRCGCNACCLTCGCWRWEIGRPGAVAREGLGWMWNRGL